MQLLTFIDGKVAYIAEMSVYLFVVILLIFFPDPFLRINHGEGSRSPKSRQLSKARAKGRIKRKVC